MNNCRLLITIVIITLLYGNLYSQKHTDQIYVDDNGVMRWSADSSELHGFGVNYTLPFAHEYRMAKKTGISLEQAIRDDVYHMARLDLDLYRVHVWDTEISDSVGNLLDNEHLRLFDFTVNEMKQRGMLFIITPLAYWGNGWPEKDEHTPGFSQKYGKAACLTNDKAIEAQSKYLSQFLNHVNPYTGIAYKDEPRVIGFEICNEPHHNGPAEQVTGFINKMVASMRQTGCTKPVFYNMSHSIQLADAYLNSNVQGGTFQWYPTNLVANHQINGNFLPHVESYRIPFAGNPKFKKMAKIVYEFDPADVGSNIMYPAMARTFREAGMQLAAQFAYDAMCWASYNTNYGTHFMNLAYTPQKAISLKIASAIFHHIELYEKYNDKDCFEGFRISYPKNLAEWICNDKFFYSNTTTSIPVNIADLKEIAGCGSSPIVKYCGTGAYFLDKLSDGVWRLEVMPDAYWIEDPYTPVSPNKQKAAVIHTSQQIVVSLTNLGNDFAVRPINSGNTCNPQVSNGQFNLVPGVYLLKRKDITDSISANRSYKNIRIDEFIAPETNLNKTVLWNNSPAEVVAGKPIKLQFVTVSDTQIFKVQVVMSIANHWKTLTAELQSPRSYTVEVPGELLTNGILRYRIIVEDRNDTTTFPGNKKGDPWNWENKDNNTYSLKLVPESAPLILWNAETDWESSYMIWNPDVNLKPSCDGETVLSIQLSKLPEVNPFDKNERNYAFKYFFGEKIKGRSEELANKKFLVVKATNLNATPQPIEIALIDKNGTVFGGMINIDGKENVFKIALNSFANTSFLVLPRPFPDFLAYKVSPGNQSFDWSTLETLQLLVKPGKQEQVDLTIEKIWLE